MSTRRRLVPTAVAALALGVQPAAVRLLAHRGRLTRHGSPGRALYDLDEIEAYDTQREPIGVPTQPEDDHGVTLRSGGACPTPGGRMRAEIELDRWGGRCGEVRLDGADIADAVTGFVLTGSAGRPLQLRLALSLHRVSVAGEMQVVVSPDAHRALCILGWTPPSVQDP